MRLIDAEGNQIGIVPIDEALRRAREATLDLVEVAGDAQPPVCRIFDYNKIVYDQKRRQREAKKKGHQVVVKELKVHVTISPHDLDVKIRHARGFLEDGNKVKLTIQYRGREITKQGLGHKIVDQVLLRLADIAEVEQELMRQGRQQHLMLTKRREPLAKKPLVASVPAASPSASAPNPAAAAPAPVSPTPASPAGPPKA